MCNDRKDCPCCNEWVLFEKDEFVTGVGPIAYGGMAVLSTTKVISTCPVCRATFNFKEDK